MTVHTVERGQGPLLVCLHGIGSSSRSFHPQLEGLSSEMRVLAWDAPGYGASDELPAEVPEGIGAYADEVASLITGGSMVVLLGVSWGGVIAIEVALRYPELLCGLVLISASRGSGRSEASRQAMESRSVELEELGIQEFARRRAWALLSETASPEALADVERTMIASLHPGGHRRAAAAMAATNYSARLREVTVPTLVVCGSADRITGVAEGEALARGIPEATLVVLDGVGHLANQEAPEAVNAWVASFVAIITEVNRSNPASEDDRLGVEL